MIFTLDFTIPFNIPLYRILAFFSISISFHFPPPLFIGKYGKIEQTKNHHFTKGCKMKITQEEVTHVANLSKLRFSEEETAAFATTLSKIVDMVELLGEVDTTGVAPTTTMADRKTVLRPDVAEEGTDRDRLFKNVPEQDNYYIKVPAILDDGGDA